ncbi:MFS general substrate transporter [Atractiella rhizophila]|nr:MFS general substrate transporter [Atractiella rhizophila]
MSNEKELYEESQQEKIGSSLTPIPSYHIDHVAEKKLVRKLDMTILPAVTIVYLLNFIDRANIGNARAAGLERDLKLKGYEFNVCASIFFVAYVLTEIPSNLLLKRVGFMMVPIALIVFGWITFSIAYIHDFGDLVGVRIVLGVAEATTLPGCTYLLGRYYRRSEIVWRIGIFVNVSAGLSGGFGGLLASGFLHVAPIAGRTTWRSIFFVEGIITIGIGILFLFLFPADPLKTRLFNEEERELAIRRVLADQPAVRQSKEATKLTLVLRALTSVTGLACTLGFILNNIIFQGITVFLPSIIGTLGHYTPVEIQLRTVPVYMAAVVWAVIINYISLRTRNHSYCIIGSISMTVIGYALWLSHKEPKVRYAALFLNTMGSMPVGPFWLSWAMANASPSTVQAVTPALVTGVGALGSIVGTWIYLPKDQPGGYRTGNIVNETAACCLILTSAALAVWIRWENQEREKGKRDHRYNLPKEEVEVLGSKHPEYRYHY